MAVFQLITAIFNTVIDSFEAALAVLARNPVHAYIQTIDNFSNIDTAQADCDGINHQAHEYDPAQHILCFRGKHGVAGFIDNCKCHPTRIIVDAVKNKTFRLRIVKIPLLLNSTFYPGGGYFFIKQIPGHLAHHDIALSRYHQEASIIRDNHIL
ncbi:hypothetical protein D3C75_248550 [compost metagenome]